MVNEEFFYLILNESIEDFPGLVTKQMYKFAKRKHDDTYVVRKFSGDPYFVHPEGVAKIILNIGGTETEIKAALAHDLIEDAGAVYEDIVEKFGKKVADIVKEITNDNTEISKIGKENYINRELISVSSPALTVKLADILYNIKDNCTNSSLVRMFKNLLFCKRYRNNLKDSQLDLIEDGLAFAKKELKNRNISL